MFMEKYKSWLKAPLTKEELAELSAISDDAKEIEDRFYTELEFGTAGLRGVLGMGTNRMNEHVIKRATQGLCDFLKSFPDAKTRGVAIAYDSRRKSSEFAKETALVLCQNGIKTYLYSTLHSVPQLSFTVCELSCIAGVVITASHNPPQYNGYKVYWEHGGQMNPEYAGKVYDCIQNVDWFTAKGMDEAQALKEGLLQYIGADVDEIYYKKTRQWLMHEDLLHKKGGELSLVYTPLHGSGAVPVQSILKQIGIKNVSVVKEQELPNPDFPTVKAPNPEDPAAFDLAFKLANKVNADAILATDPDSDRLGVAVRKHDGEFAVLTGNQIGSLLLHYILSSLEAQGRLPKNALVVKSIVSTRMADAICKRFGVNIKDVLTGFRFISDIIDECEKSGKHEFVFGFEESYGFLRGNVSRDKDAICSAMLIAEACVFYREQGKTLYDVLMDMYNEYGCYSEKVKSFTLEGKEGLERIAAAMSALREAPPTALAGSDVVKFEDFKSGIAKNIDGTTATIPLPTSNVLRFFTKNGAWACVRPSGTEPKLKLYTGACAPTEDAAVSLALSIIADLEALISPILKK